MFPLSVQILGSGNAAQKHKAAFDKLSKNFRLVESDPDIVDICTINSKHFEQAKQSLLDGRHVIIEKPVCGSLADCDRLARFQAESGKHVFPIFQYRFARHAPLTRETSMRWRREKAYHDGWRGSWSQSYGGSLVIHAIHLIDLAIREFGMPRIVMANIDVKSGVDRYSRLNAGEPGNMFRIETLVDPHVTQGGFYHGESANGYVEQFRRIHEAITVGTPPPVTLAEARRSIEVITAAYWSAYTKDPAILPIGPEHFFYNGWSETFSKLPLAGSGKA